MKLSTMGDMAQATLLRRETGRVRNEMNRLTAELGSGRKSDLQGALRGKFAPVAGLERSLALGSAFQISGASVGRLAEGQQIALERVQATLTSAGPEFLKVASMGEETQLDVTLSNARRQLEGVISALNTTTESQSLFSGAATDRPALAPPADILAALETAVAGALTPTDLIDAVNIWFDTPGGGFDTVAYTGSTTARDPVAIAEGESEALTFMANDPAIRETIKGLAVAAVMDRGILGGDMVAQKAVLQSMGSVLLGATDQLTAARADIGFAQARIDAVQTRGAAEAAGFEQALSALRDADPYETASRLQQVQAQLETLYTVTARISRLSLTSFMR